MKTKVRPSHPHVNSSIVRHSIEVRKGMKKRVGSSLIERYSGFSNFICDVVSLAHDILKDTRAFEIYLTGTGGRRGDRKIRHTGGGAALGFYLAERILKERPDLLPDECRPIAGSIVPCVIFAVISAHHGGIKRSRLKKEHGLAIKEWIETSGRASEELFKILSETYGVELFVCDAKRWIEEKVLNSTENFWTPPSVPDGESAFTVFFLTRLFLGALAMADEESAAYQSRGIPLEDGPFNWATAHIASPVKPPSRSAMDVLRSSFQTALEAEISADPGVYTVKAPTGLGKTLGIIDGVAGIERATGPVKVFYAAPTVTVLNQAVSVFTGSGAVKDGDLMEVHYLSPEKDGSEDTEEDDYDREVSWDAGMIVTTYHKIISLFSDTSKKRCRLLYGLKNAVFIFDECQALTHMQYPLFASISAVLTRLCGCRIFFMSATPQTGTMWSKALSAMKWTVIPDNRSVPSLELIERLGEKEEIGGRREIVPTGSISTVKTLGEELVRYRKEHPDRSILVLTNLAKDAVSLFSDLNDRDCRPDYCITAYKRPKDVRIQLAEASSKLTSGEPVFMIATSIVQAGLDLDFDTGFIDLNELSSFRQGCGRVGRVYDRSRGKCTVYCFELVDDEGKQMSSWYRQRYGHISESDGGIRKITAGYEDITAGEIGDVLQKRDQALSESDIEELETRNLTGLSDLYTETKNIICRTPLFGKDSFDFMFNLETKPGFDFSRIFFLLNRELSKEESCKPIALFLPEEKQTYDKIKEEGIYLETIRREISDIHTGMDFFRLRKKLDMTRKSTKKKIAPYLLQRSGLAERIKDLSYDGAFDVEGICCVLCGENAYDKKGVGWKG